MEEMIVVSISYLGLGDRLDHALILNQNRSKAGLTCTGSRLKAFVWVYVLISFTFLS